MSESAGAGPSGGASEGAQEHAGADVRAPPPTSLRIGRVEVDALFVQGGARTARAALSSEHGGALDEGGLYRPQQAPTHGGGQCFGGYSDDDSSSDCDSDYGDGKRVWRGFGVRVEGGDGGARPLGAPGSADAPPSPDDAPPSDTDAAAGGANTQAGAQADAAKDAAAAPLVEPGFKQCDLALHTVTAYDQSVFASAPGSPLHNVAIFGAGQGALWMVSMVSDKTSNVVYAITPGKHVLKSFVSTTHMRPPLFYLCTRTGRATQLHSVVAVKQTSAASVGAPRSISALRSTCVDLFMHAIWMHRAPGAHSSVPSNDREHAIAYADAFLMPYLAIDGNTFFGVSDKLCESFYDLAYEALTRYTTTPNVPPAPSRGCTTRLRSYVQAMQQTLAKIDFADCNPRIKHKLLLCIQKSILSSSHAVGKRPRVSDILATPPTDTSLSPAEEAALQDSRAYRDLSGRKTKRIPRYHKYHLLRGTDGIYRVQRFTIGRGNKQYALLVKKASRAPPKPRHSHTV